MPRRRFQMFEVSVLVHLQLQNVLSKEDSIRKLLDRHARWKPAPKAAGADPSLDERIANLLVVFHQNWQKQRADSIRQRLKQRSHSAYASDHFKQSQVVLPPPVV